MNKVFIPIELAVPIEKDGKELTTIEIRKPCAGDLRGLNLVDVCQMDFDAHSTLLPRISSLNERDLLNMDPANWAPLQTEIAGFFRGYETLIERVEYFYADIALVFHWPPSEMDLLSLDDLMLFREEARIRHQPPERT